MSNPGRVALLVASLALAAVATSPATAKQRHCHPKGTRTLLENSSTTVFQGIESDSGGTVTIACHRATDERYYLADTADEEYVFPHSLRIKNKAVTWALDWSPNPDEPGRETDVFVLRYLPNRVDSGGWALVVDQRAGSQLQARVGSIVVRGSGAVAWIACPFGHVPEGTLAPTCTRAGRRDRVYRVHAGAERRQLIARSRKIDPRSLRLNGVRMVWTQGTRSQSARL